jgi:hypothetical protein
VTSMRNITAAAVRCCAMIVGDTRCCQLGVISQQWLQRRIETWNLIDQRKIMLQFGYDLLGREVPPSGYHTASKNYWIHGIGQPPDKKTVSSLIYISC